MSNEPLPENLKELEDALIRRAISPQNAELRERVLQAVEHELATVDPHSAPAGERWNYPAAAAVALALLNLGVIAASGTDFVPTTKAGVQPPEQHRLDFELKLRQSTR